MASATWRLNDDRGNAMEERDYHRFRDFLERASGIVLGEQRQYLVRSRLAPIMKEHGIDGLGLLMERMESGRSPGLKGLVIDAMTTNETSWFRDPAQFIALREQVLPEVLAKQSTRLRVWSAACSSGQEPYTLSMAMQDLRAPLRLPAMTEIVATDIAPTMLRFATQAEYCCQSAQRGITEEQRRRYFEPVQDCWRVRPEIRARVRFREMNLLDSFAALGRFDIIFCRNVLIYFSADVKTRIVQRMADVLTPQGYLFLGASESLSGVSDRFEMQRGNGAIFYRLK